MDDAGVKAFDVVLYIADRSASSQSAVRNLMRWLRDEARRQVRWSIHNVSLEPLGDDHPDRVVEIPTLVVRAPVACRVTGDLCDLDVALRRAAAQMRAVKRRATSAPLA
jgi:hypothetical protein